MSTTNNYLQEEIQFLKNCSLFLNMVLRIALALWFGWSMAHLIDDIRIFQHENKIVILTFVYSLISGILMLGWIIDKLFYFIDRKIKRMGLNYEILEAELYERRKNLDKLTEESLGIHSRENTAEWNGEPCWNPRTVAWSGGATHDKDGRPIPSPLRNMRPKN